MKDKKTTIAGIITLIGGICAALAGYLNGTIGIEAAGGTIVAAIATGIGLLTAADSKKE